MNFVRFLRDFFAVDGSGNTTVKYAQGGVYPATAETQSQVMAGGAEPAEPMPELPVLEAVDPVSEPVLAAQGTVPQVQTESEHGTESKPQGDLV